VGGGVAERAESALVVGVMALPPVVQAADAVDVVARQDSGIGEQLVAQRTHGHGVRLFQRCRLRRRCRHDPPPSFTDRIRHDVPATRFTKYLTIYRTIIGSLS